MFKFEKVTTSCVLLVLLSIDGFSGSNIKDTKHNLAYTKGGIVGNVEDDELCVYCHTPSAAVSSIGSQPLWSKAGTSKAFSIYSTSNDSATPANPSMACLSCHDGVNAVNVSGLNAAEMDPLSVGSGVVRGVARNHPVSVAYTSGVAGLKIAGSSLVGWSGATSINDLLRNNKVECGSCHDPHESTNGTFLRISNAGAALCTGCHMK
ncbi:MAG: hypothetical protein QG558_977 [Campylobacterota bacterium]|nr:hypothetical protein [Campylobacterota bacterium]